jgi:hypothetical protein
MSVRAECPGEPSRCVRVLGVGIRHSGSYRQQNGRANSNGSGAAAVDLGRRMSARHTGGQFMRVNRTLGVQKDRCVNFNTSNLCSHHAVDQRNQRSEMDQMRYKWLVKQRCTSTQLNRHSAILPQQHSPALRRCNHGCAHRQCTDYAVEPSCHPENHITFMSEPASNMAHLYHCLPMLCCCQ